MVIDLNIYCLLCLKLIKVFKDAIFEKNNMKINKQKKNPDAQSSKVQYIIEILIQIRKWSRENDGEFVVISFIVYVIVKPYHFLMSCLRRFQGPSCFQYKSDLAMHKSSLCILSARCLKHVSNLDFPSNSCYLFIYLQCIPEKQLDINTNCTLRAGIRIAFQDEIKQKEFK